MRERRRGLGRRSRIAELVVEEVRRPRLEQERSALPDEAAHVLAHDPASGATTRVRWPAVTVEPSTRSCVNVPSREIGSDAPVSELVNVPSTLIWATRLIGLRSLS